jgi:3-oxoacyl-[acyl-carrier protein] reductase
LHTARLVVLGSGASSGIGCAIAEACAADEAQLLMVARSESVLSAVAAELASARLAADVGERGQVATLAEEVARRFGSLDVLVKAAGFMLPLTTATSFEDAEALWDESVDADLRGSFVTAVAHALLLRRPGRRTIDISSIGAFIGGSSPGGLAYAAAKAGLTGLTHALAREHRASENLDTAHRDVQYTVPRTELSTESR